MPGENNAHAPDHNMHCLMVTSKSVYRITVSDSSSIGALKSGQKNVNPYSRLEIERIDRTVDLKANQR